jgi:hypothetical protein
VDGKKIFPLLPSPYPLSHSSSPFVLLQIEERRKMREERREKKDERREKREERREKKEERRQKTEERKENT